MGSERGLNSSTAEEAIIGCSGLDRVKSWTRLWLRICGRSRGLSELERRAIWSEVGEGVTEDNRKQSNGLGNQGLSMDAMQRTKLDELGSLAMKKEKAGTQRLGMPNLCPIAKSTCNILELVQDDNEFWGSGGLG
ncbi:hypothetical protein C8J56DRAFT_886959 [Mycena floridula]|nr:hypothetical protein C8J56DRAFT_886959 [Mycena floridula]